MSFIVSLSNRQDATRLPMAQAEVGSSSQRALQCSTLCTPGSVPAFPRGCREGKNDAIGGLALFTARQLRRPKVGEAMGSTAGPDGPESNALLPSIAAGNPERDVEAPKEDECIDGVLSDPLVHACAAHGS